MAAASPSFATSRFASHVVLNSSLGEVHTVLVAGELRGRGGRLVGVDTARMVEARKVARDRVLRAAGAGSEMRRTHWDWTVGSA